MGDITTRSVDAIVNAANSSLLGGGGVDGAIHRAAGPELLNECRLLGGCPPGEARITFGYNLPARRVIHTVGPLYRDGSHGEAAILASCYRNSIRLARSHRLRSIAFPAISTGAFGYPLDRAVKVAVEASLSELEAEDQIDRIEFVCSDGAVLAEYERILGGRESCPT